MLEHVVQLRSAEEKCEQAEARAKELEKQVRHFLFLFCIFLACEASDPNFLMAVPLSLLKPQVAIIVGLVANLLSSNIFAKK